jgi:UDP-N-acetylglucosamine--N-acetylmuramyl-(pentapeptide) pyrophosphoryl-undecaprenol N-acetylglucosamine transferase
MTTKLLSRYVDKVLLTVEEAEKYLPQGKNYLVTGTPIRQEILTADRAEARKKLGVGDRVCLLSFGGSLGATPINKAVADVIAHFKGRDALHQIHATGSYDYEDFPGMLAERQVSAAGDRHLDIREYLYDMAECLAAADIVLCRSGAVTLAELECVGRASILVPSPYLAENHQYHNAMVLAGKNAAIVIEEKDLSGEKLCAILEELIADPQEIRNLGRNAASLAITDANKRICNEIYALIR